MTSRARPEVAWIGAGRLAAALAPALRDAGYRTACVTARRRASARRLAGVLPGAVASTSLARAARSATLLLVAVPDGQVRAVAARLAAVPSVDWPGRTVLHHAGALGTEVLATLESAGAQVGVLHPLQVLGDPRIAVELLAGSRARIEGTPAARRTARRLARDLGLVPLPRQVSATEASRTAYHAAAAMAGNDLLGLLTRAARVLETTGLGREEALRALVPLARGALEHLARGGTEAARTGPVARGDHEVVARHLEELARRDPEAAEIHRRLSLALLELAAGQPPRTRRRLERVLGGRPPRRKV